MLLGLFDESIQNAEVIHLQMTSIKVEGIKM
jgi:hypothetical protein